MWEVFTRGRRFVVHPSLPFSQEFPTTLTSQDRSEESLTNNHQITTFCCLFCLVLGGLCGPLQNVSSPCANEQSSTKVRGRGVATCTTSTVTTTPTHHGCHGVRPPPVPPPVRTPVLLPVNPPVPNHVPTPPVLLPLTLPVPSVNPPRPVKRVPVKSFVATSSKKFVDPTVNLSVKTSVNPSVKNPSQNPSKLNENSSEL